MEYNKLSNEIIFHRGADRIWVYGNKELDRVVTKGRGAGITMVTKKMGIRDGIFTNSLTCKVSRSCTYFRSVSKSSITILSRVSLGVVESDPWFEEGTTMIP
jgi:hypothetical protein